MAHLASPLAASACVALGGSLQGLENRKAHGTEDHKRSQISVGRKAMSPIPLASTSKACQPSPIIALCEFSLQGGDDIVLRSIRHCRKKGQADCFAVVLFRVRKFTGSKP